MVQASSSIDISSWESISFKQVKFQADKAAAEGKYLFVWDKHGNVPLFFKYQGALQEFSSEVILTSTGGQTVDMALEKLRAQILTSGSYGQSLMLDLGETMPDFKQTYTKQGVFPAEQVFNKSQWQNRDNRLQLRREDESITNFTQSDGFQLSIRSCAESEQQLQQLMQKIPCIEQFKFIIVQ